MLVLVLAWLSLALVCTIIGAGVLALLGSTLSQRAADCFTAAVWLGTTVLAAILLAVSFAFPLRPSVGIAVAMLLAACCLAPARARQTIQLLAGAATASSIAAIVALAVVVALFAAREPAIGEVALADTGLYHYGLIAWLSSHGTVPGLALLHDRFGFASSWFALGAPFDAGVLRGRVGPLLGGYAFFLGVLHALGAWARIVSRQASAPTYFLGLALLPVLGSSAAWHSFLTPSPDLPLLLLIVLVAWTWLLLTEDESLEHAPRRTGDHLLPVLLAGGAAALKMSGLALLIATLLLLALWRRQDLRGLALAGAAALALILPALAFGLITTGCAAYPTSAACVDLPWRLEPELVGGVSRETSWARWSGEPPSGATAWNWIPSWILGHRLLTAFIGTSALAAVALLRRRTPEHLRRTRPLLVFSAVGSLLVLWWAPSARFGLVAFAAIPLALAGALFLPPLHRLKGLGRPSANLLAFAAIAGLLAIPMLLVPGLPFHPRQALDWLAGSDRDSLGRAGIRALAPAPLPTPSTFRRVEVNGIVLRVAGDDGLCWAAELPCVPRLRRDLERLQLRDSVRGLAAGFRRASKPTPHRELPRQE